MSDKLTEIQQDGKVIDVLLVEDDSVFRSIIAKNLTRRGLVVREAENGLVAKTIFELDPKKFSLIISDIRMPEMDGVTLLKLVRAAGSTPFIVMTGFSELIEAKNAFELGASEFLPKPVRTEALLEAIVRCLRPEEKVVESVEPEKPKEDEYCQIHVDEFVSTSHLRSDIYLKLGEKYVKAAHKGEAVPIDRLRKYQANNVDYLYVRIEDFRSYVNLNIQVSNIVNQRSGVKRESKLRVLKHTAEVITENCFRTGFDKALFDSASRVVLDTMNLISEDEDILFTLTNMQSGANKTYVHAVAVSLFSAMIAKSVGWVSISTQSKVSLCGLFHDLGKKEIDPAILAKKRLHLTPEDIKLIESHVLRGRDILRLMPNVPEDVAEVAYQHHENFNGTGYPRNLKGEQIHPIARIVRVADLFVNAIMPVHDEQKMDVPAALMKLEQLHDGEIDPTFLAGLARILGYQLASMKPGAGPALKKIG